MDEQNPEQVDSLNPQEDVTEVTEAAEESETSQPDEDLEQLRKRAKLSEDYKKRAEIAERENKSLKAVHSEAPELSTRDAVFLAKADIHDDDIDELIEWSKFKKIPVSKAYEQMKDTLELRAEKRATASAANKDNVRRAPAKVSDETLLERANKGDLPDSDAELERLVAARSKANRG